MRTLAGETISLDVGSRTTIGDVKAKIEERLRPKEGDLPDGQKSTTTTTTRLLRLFVKDEPLEGDGTLPGYGIVPGSTLNLVVAKSKALTGEKGKRAEAEQKWAESEANGRTGTN